MRRPASSGPGKTNMSSVPKSAPALRVRAMCCWPKRRRLKQAHSFCPGNKPTQTRIEKHVVAAWRTADRGYEPDILRHESHERQCLSMCFSKREDFRQQRKLYGSFSQLEPARDSSAQSWFCFRKTRSWIKKCI